ncbi:hypothetical protein AB0N99_21175 [Streptomyces sp. NPDC093272]|uniref:hypothetical protein n=1 Tax=Streptomyces sp. NPDC093272 TaxID=3154981 RepID=UPI00344AE9A0
MAQLAMLKPTVDHLMDAPLDQLLAEYNIEQVETRVIVDQGFTGYMTVGKSGRLVLAMPPNRSQAEREIVTRSMLGTAFGVELPDLPEPFKVSVIEADGEPRQVNPRPKRSQADEALRRVRGGQA